MSTASADVHGPSDAELISAVRAGTVDAYGQLYQRHVSAALNLARQLSRSQAEADDLVSEAFAKVLDTLRAGGGPDTAFRAYLLTAVRHTAYDRTRRERRVELSDDVTAVAPPSVTSVPFRDTAVAGLERSLAAKAFARLPERWQAVLWHTEIEGQSPAQVAPLLGLTPNGVSALAYRAREGLRQAYLQVHLAETGEARCRATVDRLGAWTRGGLSRRETAQVEKHLDECDRCRALAAELADVNGALRAFVAPIVLGGATSAYLASAATSTGGWGAAAVTASGAAATSPATGPAGPAAGPASTGGGSGGAGSSLPRQAAGTAASTAALAAVVAVGLVAGPAGIELRLAEPPPPPPRTQQPAPATQAPPPVSPEPSSPSVRPPAAVSPSPAAPPLVAPPPAAPETRNPEPAPGSVPAPADAAQPPQPADPPAPPDPGRPEPGDPDPGNPPRPAPSLALSAPSSVTLAPEQTVELPITVTNTGDGPSEPVRLSLALPEGVTASPARASTARMLSAGPTPAGSATPPSVSCTGNIECVTDRGLAAREQMTFTLVLAAGPQIGDGTITGDVRGGPGAPMPVRVGLTVAQRRHGVDLDVRVVRWGLPPATRLEITANNTGDLPGRPSVTVESPWQLPPISVQPGCAHSGRTLTCTATKDVRPGETYRFSAWFVGWDLHGVVQVAARLGEAAVSRSITVDHRNPDRPSEHLAGPERPPGPPGLPVLGSIPASSVLTGPSAPSGTSGPSGSGSPQPSDRHPSTPSRPEDGDRPRPSAPNQPNQPDQPGRPTTTTSEPPRPTTTSGPPATTTPAPSSPPARPSPAPSTTTPSPTTSSPASPAAPSGPAATPRCQDPSDPALLPGQAGQRCEVALPAPR
ncbi:RNA polymerase sigma factor, sigma-70 family [Streptoalloteichus tenebrarius]|uniref:RNA polymerase sigma factor, sigma-70 family n=1 Tax=Streptoalloteichus tenebrarius (strain ATCC 17920 / DSM 40477 / JCM 4838 / CBS 697.72 / NBRC 16177 / NCIMB 11028 / NRRL B-12390 / A12253. 1 / ISP 5477) TaxID=1933 RepID=A0ABT1HT29_STRSD|nr:sigma-70 family RNA polymerase sigma factor [Streptoalloteichus tenebrarius]MCP2258638.1 RNA polymerase sigma factor, sigma-70 family [Streptoalloteichus tenebrarius]BFF02783.1 hypothetical protein GCM10020241_44580 [Streptoalloteichus tenebrarius]